VFCAEEEKRERAKKRRNCQREMRERERKPHLAAANLQPSCPGALYSAVFSPSAWLDGASSVRVLRCSFLCSLVFALNTSQTSTESKLFKLRTSPRAHARSLALSQTSQQFKRKVCGVHTHSSRPEMLMRRRWWRRRRRQTNFGNICHQWKSLLALLGQRI
jgi:hypothetical protein